MKASFKYWILIVGLGLSAPGVKAQNAETTPVQSSQAGQPASVPAAAPSQPTVTQQPASGRAPSASQEAPLIPLTEPPQDLIGEDGKVELDLIDPFQRGSAAAREEVDEQGMSATSLGEISEEFRILAIVIPEDEFRAPMALIRLRNESNPQVVRVGDLVQINRRAPDSRGRARPGTPQAQPSFAESALNALENFSFYLQIKDIQPTYIEAYQKKSPNETIILRW